MITSPIENTFAAGPKASGTANTSPSQPSTGVWTAAELAELVRLLGREAGHRERLGSGGHDAAVGDDRGRVGEAAHRDDPHCRAAGG